MEEHTEVNPEAGLTSIPKPTCSVSVNAAGYDPIGAYYTQVVQMQHISQPFGTQIEKLIDVHFYYLANSDPSKVKRFSKL